ncbi:MAG: hypothetical protein ACI9WU_001761 [Myxococcota bacterium]
MTHIDLLPSDPMTSGWHVTDDFPAAERIATSDLGDPSGWVPEELRNRIVICTLHDGACLPASIACSANLSPSVSDGTLFENYARMRDWGANLVAARLAARLGLPGWYRVNVARVIMDFNRFPGSSPGHAQPLERLAIAGLAAKRLNHVEKRHILEEWYDQVSKALEEAIGEALVVISVHTYDEFNATKTTRPAVSLLSRSHSYQRDSRLPYLTFDPLFPDVLAESSVTRILRDRVALTLEKAGTHVAHNYPYCLPDGSLEVRCQPWFYFRKVRASFEEDWPETKADDAYDRVWRMLLNTNHRSSASRALSGYLHRFVKSPPGHEVDFDRARAAYEAITRYMAERPNMAHDYRMTSDRTSALCVEVRKDLINDFENGVPTGKPHSKMADTIAAGVAEGLVTYFREDRPQPS